MNELQYANQMHYLRKKLERIAAADPYDPVAHGDVLDKINELNHLWFIALGTRRLIRIVLYISAILFVLYILYMLLCEV